MVSEAKRATVSGGKVWHCRGWSFLAACGHSLLPSGTAKDAHFIAIALPAAMTTVIGALITRPSRSVPLCLIVTILLMIVAGDFVVWSTWTFCGSGIPSHLS